MGARVLRIQLRGIPAADERLLEHRAHRDRDRGAGGRGERAHPGLAGFPAQDRRRAASRGVDMAIPISYNVRNVTQRPISTLTTAIGVALTVTIFIGALALASGFRAALLKTGSANNAIALRKGADSEISSYLSREAASILRAHPEVAGGPPGPARGRAPLGGGGNKTR